MRTTILLLSLVLFGCASTKITDVSVNREGESGAYDKLMVIGLGASDDARVEFESRVTEQLTTQGVTSVASNAGFPSQKDVTTDAVRERARADGADGVLVTRLVAVRADTPQELNEGERFEQYWSRSGTYAATPETSAEVKTYVIETKLFDVATEKPVYSATTQSFAPSSRDQMIAELVPLLVNDLSKRGLLAKK